MRAVCLTRVLRKQSLECLRADDGSSGPVTAGYCYSAEIDTPREGALAAGGFIRFIVENNMNEIFWQIVPDGNHRLQSHQCSTIAVQYHYPSPWRVHGNTERDAGSATHGPDYLEVIWTVSILGQLSSRLSRGCHKQCLLPY